MTDTPAAHREELMLLYQITVGDLTYFKTQQWSVANYAFLRLAGIIGVAQVAAPLGTCERVFLVILVMLVAAVALVVLSKLQASIRVRHSRLEATRQSFSAAFNAAWAAEVKGPELVHSIWFLRAAVAIGAVIVTWLILRGSP